MRRPWWLADAYDADAAEHEGIVGAIVGTRCREIDDGAVEGRLGESGIDDQEGRGRAG
jgi:hypothetical protein